MCGWIILQDDFLVNSVEMQSSSVLISRNLLKDLWPFFITGVSGNSDECALHFKSSLNGAEESRELFILN